MMMIIMMIMTVTTRTTMMTTMMMMATSQTKVKRKLRVDTDKERVTRQKKLWREKRELPCENHDNHDDDNDNDF